MSPEQVLEHIKYLDVEEQEKPKEELVKKKWFRIERHSPHDLSRPPVKVNNYPRFPILVEVYLPGKEEWGCAGKVFTIVEESVITHWGIRYNHLGVCSCQGVFVEV